MELCVVGSESVFDLLQREADDAFKASDRKRTVELIEEIYEWLDGTVDDESWPIPSEPKK